MAKVIIFDTETTGLDNEDEIIQIGAIIIDTNNKEYYEKFDELFSSNVPIKIEAMATHGIRNEQINDKPKFKDSKFLNKLNELNNNTNYLIAHNLDFDLGMLKKYGFDNKLKLIDTLQCSKHCYEINEQINDIYKLPNYKLQTFRYLLLTENEENEESNKYKIEIKAHNAIGDVVILKLFLRKLYERVQNKYKLKTKDVLDKLVNLTKKPAEVKILNFGKYRGETIHEIYKKDSGYIKWLYNEQTKQKNNNDSNYDKNLYYTLDKIMNKQKVLLDKNNALDF